jgi:hypothetical protein
MQAHSLPILIALLLVLVSFFVVTVLSSDLLRRLLWPLLAFMRLMLQVLHSLHVLRAPSTDPTSPPNKPAALLFAHIYGYVLSLC